jgi:small subunit ribosomal protein S13
MGVDLPRSKRVAYALTYIHGIGITSARKIIEVAEINSETRISDLTTDQTLAVRTALESSD